MRQQALLFAIDIDFQGRVFGIQINQGYAGERGRGFCQRAVRLGALQRWMREQHQNAAALARLLGD